MKRCVGAGCWLQRCVHSCIVDWEFTRHSSIVLLFLKIFKLQSPKNEIKIIFVLNDRYLDFSLNTKCRKELNDRQRFILHGVINTLFPKKKNLNFFKKTLIFKVPYAFAWTPILYQYYSVVTSGNGDVYR